jgi:glutamate-1-semialdehyde 2,1-aminomutase
VSNPTASLDATLYLPGGVGASARYNPSLGRAVHVQKAAGCRIWDTEGREYIDFNLAHGAAFLGYNHPVIRTAYERSLEIGLVSGYEIDAHAELARTITETVPCAERVRYANTGSEGTMIALRLARAHTGRSKILKFWGHFHGLYDYVMYNSHEPTVAMPPGEYVTPVRESAGMPAELDDLVLVVPWQDEVALERALREHGEQIAAIIMEPINYNQGCIVAEPSYHRFVREQATRHGCVLIYDEVLSAFRTGPDCAQGYYGVTPDLCVLGKAVAAGAPLAVVAGSAEIMNQVAPLGGVAQSGTFTGNPPAVLSALGSITEYRRAGFYDHIDAITTQLYSGLTDVFSRAGIPARVQGLGARFGIFFGRTESVDRLEDTFDRDQELTGRFIRACAAAGVYFHDYGSLVVGHHGVSAAHTRQDIGEALNRIESAVSHLNP